MSNAIAVYQVLSFPGPCLFCTIQKVGNFHATHAIMSIYNYLASSFFPDVEVSSSTENFRQHVPLYLTRKLEYHTIVMV